MYQHSELYKSCSVISTIFFEAINWLLMKGIIDLRMRAMGKGRNTKFYKFAEGKGVLDIEQLIPELLSHHHIRARDKAIEKIQDPMAQTSMKWEARVEREKNKNYKAEDVLQRMWAMANHGDKEESKLKALMLLGQHFRLWEGDSSQMVTKFTFVGKDGTEKPITAAFKEKLRGGVNEKITDAEIRTPSDGAKSDTPGVIGTPGVS